MLSFSHIDVANHFYERLKENQLSFNLDKRAFFRGNILPDKQRHLFGAHFWDESRKDYERYLQRANDNKLTDIQRSEALGIVCHFLCDYFCKYHTIQPYKSIQDHRHFLYEAQLHIKMKAIMIKRRLIGANRNEENIFSGIELMNFIDKSGSIDMLMEVYKNTKESLITDLTFQFAAVRSILINTLNLHQTDLEEQAYEGSYIGLPSFYEVGWDDGYDR